MKKALIIGGVITLLFIIALIIVSSVSAEKYPLVNEYNDEITIYRTGSCGCCKVYGTYFQNKGNKNVKTIEQDDITNIKEQYGVPSSMESCHTTIIGEYFVEGHIPLEAIEKLLKESPDIKGIAMPGMPIGSPGMPGTKKEPFVVYAVTSSGSIEEFMRI